jgi:hypothetical protein
MVHLAAGQPPSPPPRYTVVTSSCPIPAGTVSSSAPVFSHWHENDQFEATGGSYSATHDLSLLNNAHNPNHLHMNAFAGWYTFDARVPVAMVSFSYQCTTHCPGFDIQYSDDSNPNWAADPPSRPQGYSDGRTWTRAAYNHHADGSNDAGDPGGSVSWTSVGCHRFWRFLVQPSTWHSGNWYYNFKWSGLALSTSMSWPQAQSACLQNNLVLAAAHSSYELAELATAMTSARVGTAWVGASDLDSEGQWTWADGSAFDDPAAWAPAQPNGQTGQNCAVLSRTTSLLYDESCSRRLPVLCEPPFSAPRVDSTYPAFSTAGSGATAAHIVSGRRVWHDLTNLTTDGYQGLIHGFEMNLAAGRFTVHYEGVYVATAMARLDYADTGWYALGIRVNGRSDFYSGCVVMSGHNLPPAQVATYPGDPLGYANNHFTVACIMRLAVNDYVTASVYADSDQDFTISSESSGFSMALITTADSFAASRSTTMTFVNHSNSMQQVDGWSTTRAPTLFANHAFDPSHGVFSVTSAGVYLVSAMLRLDGADDGYFGVVITTNGGGDRWNNGLCLILGDPDDHYEDVALSGVRNLNADDRLTVEVYSNRDRDYRVVSAEGGFHAARLDTTIALSVGANCARGHRNVVQTGWVELGLCDDGSDGWQTDRYSSLFSHSSFDSVNGRFTAPADGMYFASALVRLDRADTGIMALALLTNGEQTLGGGMSVTDSALASSYESLVVTGVRAL